MGLGYTNLGFMGPIVLRKFGITMVFITARKPSRVDSTLSDVNVGSWLHDPV